MSTETVRSWPQIEAVVRTDGSGEVRIDGSIHPVVTNSLEEARIEVLRRVTENAVQLGRPVRANAEGPEGMWRLVVHPDGTVVPEDDVPVPDVPVPDLTAPRPPESQPADPAPIDPAPIDPAPTDPAPIDTIAGDSIHSGSHEPGAGPALDAPPAVAPADGLRPEPSGLREPAAADLVAPGREERASFLTQVSVEEPAEQGFRGWLTRLGLPVGPSEAERAERADERDVSQHWPGPRTIAIVNGKGGAGKTPSSVLLSAVFAQFGGAGVVAWDNNQTRGTLGWRTEKGPHDATLLDLLPRADHLLGPSAQAADLARYVHHQTRDRFDVLRSKPMAMAHEQRIASADVDAIHAVLSKYYRLIVIDSGNDESDPMWQRMIDHTDQLVIATTTRDDHAEAGALLLEGLAERDGRSAYLAQQAVAVVSQADQKAPAEEVRKVAAGYESLAREVVTVPFDPGMVDGHLRYGALRPTTRRAWLAAGAAVARGL
ncbi:MinD/ParA family ATP-binding protein [Myceligenerans indicum]|uniref:AAA family ATPase n=1 Tax=Myceligenerans indicum TaxID=2593663 RepID=A0ABS1LQW4_9MICO|nr:AAA family ATPase [Myceligenerans indicum]MBL0888620.1 AAA family ATPase [Myceligenerans indicum]